MARLLRWLQILEDEGKLTITYLLGYLLTNFFIYLVSYLLALSRKSQNKNDQYFFISMTLPPNKSNQLRTI